MERSMYGDAAERFSICASCSLKRNTSTSLPLVSPCKRSVRAVWGRNCWTITPRLVPVDVVVFGVTKFCIGFVAGKAIGKGTGVVVGIPCGTGAGVAGTGTWAPCGGGGTTTGATTTGATTIGARGAAGAAAQERIGLGGGGSKRIIR